MPECAHCATGAHTNTEGDRHLMAEFTLTCIGIDPVMTHNARLSDPLDPIAQAIAKVSGKRKKTDEDHEEIARLEHLGGLYFDAKLGPCMPGQNIERMLVDAAKKYKLGSTLKSAMVITDLMCPIVYQGPRTTDGLWADKQFVHRGSVKVGMSRVMRTRPIFPSWEVQASGDLDESQLDQRQFEQIVETAGRLICMGEFRPRYGRFRGEVKFQ